MPSLQIICAACLTVLVAMTTTAMARSDARDAGLCLAAASSAARDTGVPYEVLLAISLVETGRDGSPWPWTINVGGKGHWPDTAEDAAALVEAALQAGLTNIDLGCFQLNLHWHAGAFQSVEDMLDPSRNALYAAQFLAEKFAATGDWSAAAAAYHSATPEHAERYQTQFDAAWSGLEGAEAETPIPAEVRLNRFPLLVAGQGGTHGSLVPITKGGIRLVGGP